MKGPSIRDQLTCRALLLQEELVRSYNLPFEIVGTKAETRIRILPKGFLPEEARESQVGKEWTRSEGWAHI